MFTLKPSCSKKPHKNFLDVDVFFGCLLGLHLGVNLHRNVLNVTQGDYFS